MYQDTTKVARKLGSALSSLLSRRTNLKSTEIGKQLKKDIGDHHKEGEVMRRALSKLLAKGKENFDKHYPKKMIEGFNKTYEPKAKLLVSQARPFLKNN